MMRRLQTAAAILAAIFAAIQAIPASHTNPETDSAKSFAATASPPAEVKALLIRCCADCHSHETRWPWYSKVAPVSWFVAGHVDEGRSRLNLSTWAEADAIRRRVYLEGMAKAVDDGHMPPASYQWLHREAVLGDAEKKLLAAWLGAAAKQARAVR